jgi:hypothetical protein
MCVGFEFPEATTVRMSHIISRCDLRIFSLSGVQDSTA